ncbi:hypothetical protein Acr_07g0011220 [Actinidia rufa]|uniref:Chromo domain-containing protein n=1 Tax=Actinidia rufa TaxID=165716 RepID=A0A7J0EXJ9_9ERIC|nr:hypothetical protein Acr_07g0011220 [Actinidia rufa]
MLYTGHRCAIKQLFIFDTEAEGGENTFDEVVNQREEDTLFVEEEPGSTHNFVDQWVAQLLSLAVKPVMQFWVTVANGERLLCTEKYEGVSILIQGLEITVTLYSLQLIGWTPAYSNAVMGREVAQGEVFAVAVRQPPGIMPQYQSSSYFGLFPQVWEEPQSLPPSRAFDHRIVLKEGTGPVNVRPTATGGLSEQQRWVPNFLGMIMRSSTVQDVPTQQQMHFHEDSNPNDHTPYQHYWPMFVGAPPTTPGTPEKHPHLLSREGVLLYKGRLVIPPSSPLRTVLLIEVHDSTIGDARSPSGLLQLLPVSTQVWEDISLDFVEGLPISSSTQNMVPPPTLGRILVQPPSSVAGYDSLSGLIWSSSTTLVNYMAGSAVVAEVEKELVARDELLRQLEIPLGSTDPPFSEDNTPVLQPLFIRDYRWIKQGGYIMEALVQWASLPIEDATWEAVDISAFSFLTSTLRTRIVYRGADDRNHPRRNRNTNPNYRG